MRLSVRGVYEYLGATGPLEMEEGNNSIYHGTPTWCTLLLTLAWSSCKTEELG